MKIFSEKFIKSEELEKRIKIIYSFNKEKYNFKQGKMIDIENINIKQN